MAMRLKTLMLVLSILVLTLSATACVYFSSAPAGYAFVKTQHIIGSPDGALAGYQMKFTIHSGQGIDDGTDVYLDGHSESWPGDIRFAGADLQALPYWLESYDANTATVWVNVSSIPASGTTIYLYYGKQDDPGASDGKSTFEIFDDFDVTAPILGAWNISGNGTCVLVDGSMRLSASGNDMVQAHCQESIPSPDYVIETVGNVVTPYRSYGVNNSYPSKYDYSGKYRPGILFRQGASPGDKAIGFDTWAYDIDGWTVFDFPKWSYCEDVPYADISKGDPYDGRFHIQVCVDGMSYTAAETLRGKSIYGTTDLDGSYFGLLAEKSTTDYDWVFVRNYSPHGPVYGAWADGTTEQGSLESWLPVLIVLLLASIVILLVVAVVIGLLILIKGYNR